MKNRKGTEKPIEIFVALFIILAVALVMLKLFQSQIAEKQKELSDVQQEQKAQELKSKVQLACQQKCTEASNNGCSPASLASLCTYNSQNVLGADSYVDLNNNKENGFDTTLLAGIAVCEDKVYCFHMVDSCCAQRISPDACVKILDSYYKSKGFTNTAPANERMNLVNKNLDPGTCVAQVPSDTKLWSQLAGTRATATP
jgi:hypothetical protein